MTCQLYANIFVCNNECLQGHPTSKLSQKPLRDIFRPLVMYNDCLKICFYELEEFVSGYFSLVANLLGGVLLKKYIAVSQRRIDIRRTVISPKHIFHRRLLLGAHGSCQATFVCNSPVSTHWSKT